MNKSAGFLVNFFSLNISSFIIKFLNFILFIFLVRYLSIEDYGIYILTWTVVNFFTPLLDFGTTSYSLIYVSNENKKDLNALLSFRFILSLLIFLFIIVSGLFYNQEHQIYTYILLTSFTVFGNIWYGSYVIFTSINQVAYRSSLLSLLFNILLIIVSIVALITTRSLLLVFGVIAVSYSSYAVLNYFLIKQFINYKFIFEKKLWLEIIKTSYIFVLISFFLGIYFKIDVFLLNILKSEKEVGVYSAGYKFFEALLFIIASYNIAATPALSTLFKTNRTIFYKKIIKHGTFLFALGVFVAGVTFVIAPTLLQYVLKTDITYSVSVLRIVIFALPFMLVSTIFMNTLHMYRKSLYIIYLYLFQIGINIVLNYMFIPKYSFIASSYITVLNEVVNMIILLGIFIYCLKKDENRS